MNKTKLDIRNHGKINGILLSFDHGFTWKIRKSWLGMVQEQSPEFPLSKHLSII